MELKIENIDEGMTYNGDVNIAFIVLKRKPDFFLLFFLSLNDYSE